MSDPGVEGRRSQDRYRSVRVRLAVPPGHDHPRHLPGRPGRRLRRAAVAWRPARSPVPRQPHRPRDRQPSPEETPRVRTDPAPMAAPTVPVIAPQDDIRGWQFTVNLDSAYASRCSPKVAARPAGFGSSPEGSGEEGLDSLMSPDHRPTAVRRPRQVASASTNPVAGPGVPNDADQHRSVRIHPGRVVFGRFPAHDRVLGVDTNSPGAMLGFQDQDNTPGPVHRCRPSPRRYRSRPSDLGPLGSSSPASRRKRAQHDDWNHLAVIGTHTDHLGRTPRQSEPACPSRGPRPRIPRRPPSARHLRGTGKTTALARSSVSGCSSQLFIPQPFDFPCGLSRARTIAIIVLEQIPGTPAQFDRTAASSVHLRPSSLDGDGVSSVRAGIRSLTRAAIRFCRPLRLLEPLIEQSGQSIEPLTWIRDGEPRFGIGPQLR